MYLMQFQNSPDKDNKMPEYYILEQETLRADIPIITKFPESLDALDFYSGNIMNDVSSPIIINIKTSKGVVFPDAITYMAPLFSDRLKLLLDEHGVDNIQYHEVEIIDQETKNKIGIRYWLANIIGLFDCIDKDRSTGEYDEYLEQYDFESFVIDPLKTYGARIFRPFDERMLIIINETIKDAIVSAKMEGLRVRNTRDYDGC